MVQSCIMVIFYLGGFSMSDKVELSLQEIVDAISDNIFFRIAEISTTEKFQKSVNGQIVACRGGAAIGVKTNTGDMKLWATEINSNLHDYWDDEEARYSPYAAMKVVTALQWETPTRDTGEKFSFSGAVHRGAVPLYLEQYHAWVAIGFSGFLSPQDEEIALQVLNEFFINM